MKHLSLVLFLIFILNEAAGQGKTEFSITAGLGVNNMRNDSTDAFSGGGIPGFTFEQGILVRYLIRNNPAKANRLSLGSGINMQVRSGEVEYRDFPIRAEVSRFNIPLMLYGESTSAFIPSLHFMTGAGVYYYGGLNNLFIAPKNKILPSEYEKKMSFSETSGAGLALESRIILPISEDSRISAGMTAQTDIFRFGKNALYPRGQSLLLFIGTEIRFISKKNRK